MGVTESIEEGMTLIAELEEAIEVLEIHPTDIG